MPSQKGFAHILILLILVAGLIGGLYLIQHPQIFRPKAGGGWLQIKHLSGEYYNQNSDGSYNVDSPTVILSFYAPNGLNSVSSPNGIHTVSYNIYEDPAEASSSGAISAPMTQDPTELTYRFKSSAPGTKFIFGAFTQSDGTIITNSTRVILGSGTVVSCVGNFNGDDSVNIVDFSLLRVHLGTSEGDSNYDSKYDVNGDKTVNVVDFSIWKNNFGKSCIPSYGTPAPYPTPSYGTPSYVTPNYGTPFYPTPYTTPPTETKQ